MDGSNSLARAAAVVALAVLTGFAGAAWVTRQHRSVRATPGPDGEVAEVIHRILGERAQALLDFDGGPLESHYDLFSQHGRWALEHERRRLRYLEAWSRSRRVRLVSAGATFRIPRVRTGKDDVWVSLVQSARIGYVHHDAPEDRVHYFGIGTRHAMQLVQRNGQWLLRRDWYTDPLDEDTAIPEVTPADVTASGGILLSLAGGSGRPRCAPPGLEDLGAEGVQPGLLLDSNLPGPATAEARTPWPRYDRRAAVAYALEYCGAAWGCGNKGQYNPNFRDYTDLGGDCTNFTSQVLHAGGLEMDGTWYYRKGSGGSRAWVQTVSLANYLLYSGRARLLAKGSYADVVKPTARFPRGALQELELGDVIGYQEKGQIVHLAPVTGRDPRGYLLVNSHTADRYLVPWDMGWDRSTVFWVIKVRE